MELKLTLEEARELLAEYGKVPDIPAGYTAIAFECPEQGKEAVFISRISGVLVKQYKDNGKLSGKVIILQPPPKKYRYVTDGAESERRPGDYIYLDTGMKEYCPKFHFPTGLTFTREEIPQ